MGDSSAQPDRRGAGNSGTLWSVFLFLLFTGPPKFRVRSPDAAAYGELDLATVVQLIVWIAIGLFTFYQFIAKREQRNTTGLHWLASVVIGTMGISTITSLSPSLTAFKTIQVAIAFLFCRLFIQLFGVERFLHVIMWGCLFLCTAVVVLWFFDPDSVVLIESTGEARLRGQAIYEVAHPALFGLVLLLSGVHTFGKGLRWFAVLLFGLALLFSLDRIDWLAFALTIALAAWFKPDIPGRRWAQIFVWLSPVVAIALISFLSGRRDLDSMFADSDRWGLWAFLVANTLATSPWIGTGFIAGSRLTGMEYTIPLPSGHSIFIDAFSGCGLLGLAALLALVFVLLRKAIRLVSSSKNKVSFAVGGLVFCLLLLSLVGAEIEATPFGVLFWGLVSAVTFCVGDKSPSVTVNRMLAVKTA